MRGVSERIEKLHYWGGLPRHVIDELARLLGYRDVRWIDGKLGTKDHYRINGSLVLFTDDLVAVANLEDEQHRRYDSDKIGRTTVDIFRRSSLIELRVPAYDQEQQLNWPAAWDASGAEEWPQAGAICLEAVYPDRVVELYLNEGRDGGDGQRLFEALVEDLARN